MKTRDRSPKPDRACLRCGKIKYDWVLYVPSIEMGLFSNVGPQYEGQSPPEGYESWEEYKDNFYKSIDALRKKLK